MDIEILTSALILGLVTGFHCIGMCGPVAVALPLKKESRTSKISSAALYNIGRTVTYSAMGLFFGFFGQSFAMAGFQKWVSLTMGILMILYVIFPAVFKNHLNFDKYAFKYVGKLRFQLRKLFGKRTYSRLFLIGLLNGLLPCGPVYAALAGAIAAGGAISGSLFMFLFGIGTIPVMLSVSLLGSKISLKSKKKLSKLIPLTIILIGFLFIMRGLGLGIPFLSPPDKMLKPHKKEMMMHTQSSENIPQNYQQFF
ncbi:MAG: sulfite exporter TauE/SafE family protein [Bacteroidales bacterium]|nr:sulfite exporter TauE/SafE family protein [Bacteroidales bacterium]